MSESTVVDDRPAPVEVLIPEARRRQRRRYRRSAVVVSLMALLAGGLIALLITITSSGSGTSRGPSKPPSVTLAGRATVLIRPVLCFSFWPSVARQSETGPLPACGPYALTAAALDVTPNGSGQGYSSSSNVRPDPALWGYPTSTRDTPNRVVLLGALWTATAPNQKYLLGPSEMRLSAADVGSVVDQKNRNEWTVTIHLTSIGAAAWDRVAYQNFHQLVAIDMDGKVLSTPLVQPTRSSYTSFNGVLQIPALNTANARALAAAMKG
jgi:hypothetical protein